MQKFIQTTLLGGEDTRCHLQLTLYIRNTIIARNLQIGYAQARFPVMLIIWHALGGRHRGL